MMASASSKSWLSYASDKFTSFPADKISSLMQEFLNANHAQVNLNF